MRSKFENRFTAGLAHSLCDDRNVCEIVQFDAFLDLLDILLQGLEGKDLALAPDEAAVDQSPQLWALRAIEEAAFALPLGCVCLFACNSDH
jgi:hypothetical protein